MKITHKKIQEIVEELLNENSTLSSIGATTAQIKQLYKTTKYGYGKFQLPHDANFIKIKKSNFYKKDRELDNIHSTGTLTGVAIDDEGNLLFSGQVYDMSLSLMLKIDVNGKILVKELVKKKRAVSLFKNIKNMYYIEHNDMIASPNYQQYEYGQKELFDTMSDYILKDVTSYLEKKIKAIRIEVRRLEDIGKYNEADALRAKIIKDDKSGTIDINYQLTNDGWWENLPLQYIKDEIESKGAVSNKGHSSWTFNSNKDIKNAAAKVLKSIKKYIDYQFDF